jgi:hypothetical protein
MWISIVTSLVGCTVGGASEHKLTKSVATDSCDQFGQDGAFVTSLYRHILHRDPDSDGHLAYSQALASGWSRADVANAFISSAERETLVADELAATLVNDTDVGGYADPADGLYYDPGNILEDYALYAQSNSYFTSRGNGNNADFVLALYADLLRRAPDEGAYYWVYAANTSGRGVVAKGFVYSNEYLSDVTANEYREILDREPDPSGLAAYTAFLAAGARSGGATLEEVEVSLAASDEFFANAQGAPAWCP